MLAKATRFHFKFRLQQRIAAMNITSFCYSETATANWAGEECSMLLAATPDSSSFSMDSIAEVFHQANDLLGRSFYKSTIASLGSGFGFPVNGNGGSTDIARPARRYDYTFVFVDGLIGEPMLSRAAALIRSAHRAGSRIVEVGSGAFLLARLGLLDQQSCAVHPDRRGAFLEMFPSIQVCDSMFCVGSRTISCCGKIGALELALFLVNDTHSVDLSNQIRGRLLLEKKGRSQNVYDIPSSRISVVRNRHVQAAIELMEMKIETPLTQTEIAACCGLSCRQVQRLFMTHTGLTVMEFYLQLRLDRALQLLQQTDMGILEVALSCGFSSSSYFSQSVRRRWRNTPFWGVICPPPVPSCAVQNACRCASRGGLPKRSLWPHHPGSGRDLRFRPMAHRLTLRW